MPYDLMYFLYHIILNQVCLQVPKDETSLQFNATTDRWTMDGLQIDRFIDWLTC